MSHFNALKDVEKWLRENKIWDESSLKTWGKKQRMLTEIIISCEDDISTQHRLMYNECDDECDDELGGSPISTLSNEFIIIGLRNEKNKSIKLLNYGNMMFEGI